MSDLLQDTVDLRDKVKGLLTAPAKAGGNNALWQAWNAILNQNYQATAWHRDLADLARAANWDRKGDKTLNLEPSRWSMAASTLCSRVRLGLWVALSRYVKFRWTWTLGTIKVGSLGGTNAPIGSKKAIADAEKAQDEAHAKQLEKVSDAYKAIAEGIEAGLKAMRATLSSLLDAVNDLLHRLQQAEEARLNKVVAGAGLPPPTLTKVQALLQQMSDLRTDLKNHDGSPNDAATLARTWVARRQDVEALLT